MKLKARNVVPAVGAAATALTAAFTIYAMPGQSPAEEGPKPAAAQAEDAARDMLNFYNQQYETYDVSTLTHFNAAHTHSRQSIFAGQMSVLSTDHMHAFPLDAVCRTDLPGENNRTVTCDIVIGKSYSPHNHSKRPSFKQ